jgi:ferredoxin
MRSRGIARVVMGGLALATCLAVGGVSPANAYSPDPKVSKTYIDTDDCINPFSCFESDPDDGTWFDYDKGGVATKLELWHKGKFVGKVEFHPLGEKLFLVDFRDDGDTFYVVARWWDGQAWQSPIRPPGGDGINRIRRDLTIPEGTLVDVAVYDSGYGDDLIGRTTATA